MILATLAESEAHGYAVAQVIKGRSDGVFDLPEGSIYPALHRLERSGLLASKWSKGEGRKRRVYQLTARGRRAVGEQRKDWRRFATAVEAVIA
jgi:PadR family transcriptional regulator, regulatory protein PadR